jgi:hypothetical protein
LQIKDYTTLVTIVTKKTNKMNKVIARPVTWQNIMLYVKSLHHLVSEINDMYVHIYNMSANIGLQTISAVYIFNNIYEYWST